MLEATNYTSLHYLKRVSYRIECNWKVFVDNYLDGGLHVPFAHEDLAGDLNLKAYSSTLYENFSVQSCPSSPSESSEVRPLLPLLVSCFPSSSPSSQLTPPPPYTHTPLF